jgi:hypothetical protein
LSSPEDDRGKIRLRANLSLLRSGDVPMCGDNAILDVRLAHSDEAALYKVAAGASPSTDDLMLVYLVELDEPGDPWRFVTTG